MSTTAHTPTPWENHDGLIYGIQDGESYLVCDMARENSALNEQDVINANFLLCAVNSHAELIAAIQRAIATIPGATSRGQYYADAIVADLKSALKKAEVQS